MTRTFTFALVFIILGPTFQTLASSLLENLQFQGEQCQMIEQEDISLEQEENKGEQNNEKDENESEKEYTLSNSFNMTFSAQPPIVFILLDLNHPQIFVSSLTTPPPQEV